MLEVHKSLSCEEKAKREQLITVFLTRQNKECQNNLSGCRFNINKTSYFFPYDTYLYYGATCYGITGYMKFT